MKKVFALILAVMMVLSMFAGCGNTAESADPAVIKIGTTGPLTGPAAAYGTAVEAEATTAPSLFGVYLDAGVNCDENGCYFIMRNGARVDVDMSNTDVLVLSEAVQAAGWDNAFTALDQAFGAVGSYNPWNK